MIDNRKAKDRRYYFTLSQMVLLGAAFALASLVIFFLGIIIGKGIEARKIVRPEEPLVKLPVKPLPQGTGGSSKEDLTFYDTLGRRPTQTAAPEPAAKDAAPEKALKHDINQTKPESKRDSDSRKSDKAAAKPAAAPIVNQTSEASERKEDSKPWSVQVNAYPDEKSAKQLVDRLKNKGYNAVVSTTRNKGRIWYRVRVGKYASRDEADKALGALKNKENLDRAFATSRP